MIFVVTDSDRYVNAVYRGPPDMDAEEASAKIQEAIEGVKEDEDWDYDMVADALEVFGFKRLDYEEVLEP